MTKLEKVMKDQDVKRYTKIKVAEMVIFPTVTYGSDSWKVRKKERKKTDAFELLDVEKNITSSVDKEENELFSFGGSETKKFTRSNNPPIKVTLFGHVIRAKDSLERDIMLGQVAGYRRQGKPR